MKIHHVTDEWDYTLSVEEIGGCIFLTLSILRQPDRVPDYTLDGVRVGSRVVVALVQYSGANAVVEVWLRGHRSKRGVADESRFPVKTRRAAIEQLVRVYNVLRRYENVRGSL